MAIKSVNAMGVSVVREWSGIRRYTVPYQVISTIVNESEATIVAAVSVNQYSTLAYDPFAILKTINSQQSKELFEWVVTLNYDTELSKIDRGSTGTYNGTSGSSPGGQSNQTSPELRPPVVTFSSKQVETVFDIDADGDKVCNSAGQPYNPPIMLPQSIGLLTISYYSILASYDKRQLYMNTVNSSNFTIDGYTILSGKGKCVDYKVTSVFEHGAKFYQKEVVIEEWFGPGNFNPLRVLDAGTHALVPGSVPAGIKSYLTPIIDKRTGHPVSSPVPMDGNGQSLAQGADFIYNEFTAYREENWSGLL